MATIILTGGGTAGHCMPNIALLPYLKDKFDKIFYIGSKNGMEKQIVTNAKIPYYEVPCAKLNRSITFKNLTIPFRVASGIKRAGVILDKLKPDIIFSKGGYVALPTVIAAKSRKIPVVAHESDFTIGLTNKISSKYCKKVLTSFPETAKTIHNGLYIGSPIKSLKSSKTKALDFFGFSGKKPIILVTGGSLGAQSINKILREALPLLLPKFDVLHICGKNNLMKEKTPNGYIQKEFISKMELAYAVANVCVSRAGSNTVFELLSLHKPCLLIPLPKGSSRGDQILNAKYFQKKGLVNVLNQDVLTPQSLSTAIFSSYLNSDILINNIKKQKIKNASNDIAELLSSYANPQKNK